MSIRFNPIFTFPRTGFRALSWDQFVAYLENDSSRDAWLSIGDAWQRGFLVRWLEKQNPQVAQKVNNVPKDKIEENKINISKETQLKLAFALFDKKCPKTVQNVINNSQENNHETISETLVEGKNWNVFLDGNILLEMVWVAPGIFYMGNNDEDSLDIEKPAHKVKMTRGYWMGKYQVTQEQWNALGSYRIRNNYNDKGGRFPVENVSWSEAREFCWLLNRIFKEKIDGYRFDLPTEAQWEFAARGGDYEKRNYKYSGSNNIDEVAWYVGNSDNESHKVGKKKPNILGIYDMSGNVWEWCCDWYRPYSNKEEKNPTGPVRGSVHVIRGGSWFGTAQNCRLSSRDCRDPLIRNIIIGFRVALVPIKY